MRERIYSDGMMNKRTRVFNFQFFSLCYSITPFWNFKGPQNQHGIFWGLILGSGIFLGFAGSPRDFFVSWLLAPFDHPRHLKSRVPPPPPTPWVRNNADARRCSYFELGLPVRAQFEIRKPIEQEMKASLANDLSDLWQELRIEWMDMELQHLCFEFWRN